MKTKAGIFYRDPFLSAQNETILKEREDEVKNSNRESSSHYKKRFATNYWYNIIGIYRNVLFRINLNIQNSTE